MKPHVIVAMGPARRRLTLLTLALALALGTGMGLQSSVQETPGQAASPTSPESSSALKRWWRSLSKSRVSVKADDQGTLIVESGWGRPERVYQIVKDAEGRTHESYRENGQLRPVDEAVRRWADATVRASQQTPPIPPVPPVPPPPPPTHTFGPGEAGKAALEKVQGDPRLRALLGTPIAMDAKAKGSLTTWAAGEPHGLHLFSPKGGAKADLTLFLHGPNGSALLYLRGETSGSAWSFSRLEAQSIQGGPRLNLLTH